MEGGAITHQSLWKSSKNVGSAEGSATCSGARGKPQSPGVLSEWKAERCEKK